MFYDAVVTIISVLLGPICGGICYVTGHVENTIGNSFHVHRFLGNRTLVVDCDNTVDKELQTETLR